jgi:hypothetical protein
MVVLFSRLTENLWKPAAMRSSQEPTRPISRS